MQQLQNQSSSYSDSKNECKKELMMYTCNRPAMNTVDAATTQEKFYLLGKGGPIAEQTKTFRRRGVQMKMFANYISSDGNRDGFMIRI
jgi:hypothetical protein